MATKTKDFLTKAAVKQDDGTLGSYTPIGASCPATRRAYCF